MTERKQAGDKGAKASPGMAFDPVEAALRQIFDEVASEDVPGDFSDLVAKLTDKPAGPKAK